MTDAGVKELLALKSLGSLSLAGTKVTPKGAESLKARPRLLVSR